MADRKITLFSGWDGEEQEITAEEASLYSPEFLAQHAVWSPAEKEASKEAEFIRANRPADPKMAAEWDESYNFYRGDQWTPQQIAAMKGE